MKLICKNCGTPIPARNVNIQTMTAACEVCDAVFSFTREELLTDTSKRRKIAPPEGCVVTESEGGISMDFDNRRNWGSLEWVALLIVLIAFLTPVTIGLMMLSTATAILQLIGLALLGGGMLSGYALLLSIVGRTQVILDTESLTRRHSPLYWRKTQIPRSQIESLTLESVEGFPDYRDLKVITHDGNRHRINFFQAHHAEFVKRRLEQHLEADELEATTLADLDLMQARLSDDGEIILPGDEEISTRSESQTR